MDQCPPELASVRFERYKYFQAINKLVDAALVTHERNKKPLEKLNQYNNIFYREESELTKKYFPPIAHQTLRNRINWSLATALGYPIYAEFDRKVYQQFQEPIQRGDYDLVHALTRMIPRYFIKTVKACRQTPFLLGPVNGGVPFLPGFQEVIRQEFSYLNFLRYVGRALVPGYVETYKKADKILAGSTYSLNLVKELFSLSDQKIELF